MSKEPKWVRQARHEPEWMRQKHELSTGVDSTEKNPQVKSQAKRSGIARVNPRLNPDTGFYDDLSHLRKEPIRELLTRWLPSTPSRFRSDFARRIRRSGPCWVVKSVTGDLGGLGGLNYATIRTFEGRIVTAHKWIFWQLHGSIPRGYVVDHICEDKRCANPDHLQLVTIGANVKLSKMRKAWRALHGGRFGRITTP